MVNSYSLLPTLETPPILRYMHRISLPYIGEGGAESVLTEVKLILAEGGVLWAGTQRCVAVRSFKR